MKTRPDTTEAAPYYFKYFAQVPDGDICDILESQMRESQALFDSIPEEASRHRYDPGKWSIREVVGHLTDTERLFIARAFWFARGFDTPLPSFDPDAAAAEAGAHDRSWRALVDEFLTLRHSTVGFFRGLPEPAWDRRGIASDNPFSVRALAYLTAGHTTHHLAIVRDKYLAEGR
jgi:hypothetical protein